MEPRPQRPSRATGPYISTGTPSPPPAGTTGSTGTGGFGQPPFDASSAPPAPPPAIGYDPDYSPGQPLTPLRGPRAANVVGPLLAVAALAIIVAAVAFIVSQFRGGDGDNDTTQPTTVAAVSGSPTSETGDESGTDPESDATQPVAGDSGETTAPDDAEPTRTPRVNRPTEVPGGLAGDEEPDPGGEEEPSARTAARQWLPTTGDIGDGFETVEDGTRTEEEVVESFGEGSNAAAQLAEFGWLENAYRNFELADGGEADTTGMTVSVHRFASEAGAKDAMPYFAEGSGLPTLEDAPELGEESITVQGALTGGNAFVIYVRQDEYVLRIGGFSVSGDPAELTTAVAQTMLGE